MPSKLGTKQETRASQRAEPAPIFPSRDRRPLGNDHHGYPESGSATSRSSYQYTDRAYGSQKSGTTRLVGHGEPMHSRAKLEKMNHQKRKRTSDSWRPGDSFGNGTTQSASSKRVSGSSKGKGVAQGYYPRR